MSEHTDYEITWSSIAITIRHTPDWLPGDAELVIQHIEVHAADRVPLPITETGYRSHFMIGKEALLGFDNDPVKFVVEWLDEAAQSNQWRKNRQLDLFG